MPIVKQMIRIQLRFLLITVAIFNIVYGYEKEMTVYIEAGKNECFYHPVRNGETIDIEYQVIDGGHGDLDISFSLLDPIGLVIVSDYKKPENIHRHEAGKSGDYRFCFDNTFSSYNRKTVFFELIIEQEGQSAFDNNWDADAAGKKLEELYDIQVHEIMEYVGRVHMHIARAHQILNMLRSNEARDRNLAEANYSKVNTWSLFQICAMISVGLIQVFMVRSIFDTNTRMSTFWKKLGL
ncbi:transmembrane emp24 domain-containing protein 1 isoform X1 [Anastrepha obliqua]|uniref:transmembrane emp24 domain-containing protein 1 isoform X1 n=1 Tax=Anastrepha obliqua TaxID=95512 RepID=UPI00240A1D5F|nr:transmembrane emp24 domain-containing protein 1 isoform X1 [Anastrepha obliqua]